MDGLQSPSTEPESRSCLQFPKGEIYGAWQFGPWHNFLNGNGTGSSGAAVTFDWWMPLELNDGSSCSWWSSYLPSLLGGWTNPFEKDAQVTMGEHLPQIKGEHKRYLSCHHPVFLIDQFLGTDLSQGHTWIVRALVKYLQVEIRYRFGSLSHHSGSMCFKKHL